MGIYEFALEFRIENKMWICFLLLLLYNMLFCVRARSLRPIFFEFSAGLKEMSQQINKKQPQQE